MKKRPEERRRLAGRSSGEQNISELKSSADLHVAATDRSAADRARPLRSAGSGQVHRIVEVSIRSAKVRMVEDIRGIGPELQIEALEDVEGFTHREIRRVNTR